jgi:hypothetical protein
VSASLIFPDGDEGGTWQKLLKSPLDEISSGRIKGGNGPFLVRCERYIE